MVLDSRTTTARRSATISNGGNANDDSFNGGQHLANGTRTGLGSGFGGVIAYLMHGKREDLDAEIEDRVVWTATRNLLVEESEHAALWMRAGPPRDLALVVGRAGAGKTRRRRVLGAAMAGKAAEGLAAEADIEARTLASCEYGWKDGRGELGSRDVLLVYEAGMIDVCQMHRVLHHAEQHGAKVVLLGDPDQLKAIGASDAYRGLIEQHGAAGGTPIPTRHGMPSAAGRAAGSRRTS